jgi:hypothetical protein
MNKTMTQTQAKKLALRKHIRGDDFVIAREDIAVFAKEYLNVRDADIAVQRTYEKISKQVRSCEVTKEVMF